MKNIRILSPDLLLLAEIDDYESLQFTRSYYGIGSFELRINNNKKHVDTLKKKNLVMIGNNPNKVGIIQYREIGLDESGKQSEQWVIKGSTLEVVIKQRVTVPPEGSTYEVLTGTGESVIKQLISNNVVNPSDTARKIDLITINPDLSRGKEVTISSRFTNLAEEIETISTLSEVGWKMDIDFNTNKWVLDCYEGKDRTVNQDENPPIIFSTEFETLKEASYSESDFEMKNIVYVVYEREVEETTEEAVTEVTTVGQSEGLNRFESSSDFQHNEADGITPLQFGLNELKEVGEGIHFEAQVNTHNSPFRYEEDWFLGDLVTIRHYGWGVTMHTRVTAITEIYEPSNVMIEATFGQAKPTLISKIKKELKAVKKEVR